MVKQKDTGFQRRLAAAMKLRGIGFRELERALGGGNASITKTLQRKGAKMSLERARAAARILNVKFDWLAFGDGEMESQPPAASSVRPR